MLAESAFAEKQVSIRADKIPMMYFVFMMNLLFFL
jgi:hypothetical protein